MPVAFSPTGAQQRYAHADPEMVQTIVDKYQELDANNDGMLNFQEVAELLRQGDESMTDREIRGLFNSIDKNGTGRIDLAEFTAFVFDIQPEGTDRQQKIEAMRDKAREYEREVQEVEIYGASLCPELNGQYQIDHNKTLNGRCVLERGYPESTIFYGFTEGRKLEGWFCAKRAPADGKAVIRYKMFNPSTYAETPNNCTACWEDPARKRDKRMVVDGIDVEEWDAQNREGHGRSAEYFGNAEAEAQEEEDEYEAKFGETYELDEADPAEAADWDTEWYDEAGETLKDIEGEDGPFENEGDDAEAQFDDPSDDWTDPDFPPQDSSVGGKEYGANGWTRLSEVHDQVCILKVVGPEDVGSGSGQEGNKWFLSACACVAEYPAWVQSIFAQNKLPGDHKYSVRLYHPGKKSFVRVEVDDYVPTRNGGPVFAGVESQGEIWCPLIEKAFAKLCRSYKRMAWGSVAYGLLYLCGGGGAESWQKTERGAWKRSFTKWQGAANDTIERNKAESVAADGVVVGQATIWLIITQYLELCYPVCVTASKAKAKKASLCADRAYSVIASKEVETENGIIRLLRIRNSWGDKKSSWNGRWSDDSEAWADCPAAVNACKFKHTDGQTFWMSWNDFLKYFAAIDTVKKPMPIQGCKYSKLEGFKTGLQKYGQY